MEKYLFHHEEWLLHYNCSFFNIDQIPLEARRHQVIGGTLFSLAVLFEFLYIPCLLSINKHAKNSACYSLMRFIGVLDVIVMLINGVFTGVGLWHGWVFCSHPTLIYWLGTSVTGLWSTVAMSSMILAFNRCVTMYSPSLGKRLFDGNMVYLWQIGPLAYGFYFFFFEKPALFSAPLCAWFFNPFVLYQEDYVHYVNNMHSFTNMMVAFGLPALYVLFFCALAVKMSLVKGDNVQNQSSKKQYGMFIQVFVINLFAVIGCSIYVYMNFVVPQVWLVVLGSFAWLFIHGLPSIIYLVLNKTVRHDTKVLFHLTSAKIGLTSQSKGNENSKVQPRSST